MKKFILFGAAVMMAVTMMAQNPTVSVSKVVFEYCETTEGDTTLEADPSQFPLTFCGYTFNNFGTKVVTTVNARGCDSIVSYIVKATSGVVEGEFSVSSSLKVKFAHGNLRYRASDGVWGFAINQYDRVGNNSNNIEMSSTSSNWIDLLGYGTSGYNGSVPYLHSTAYTDYPAHQKNISGTNYDWGVNNPIYNGGNVAGQWRTLTKDEWSYLLTGRTNATDKRSYAQVNGVNGLVILPDLFTWPFEYTWVVTSSAWSVNTFTSEQWQQMEKAGAVFLPAGGYREGTTINDFTSSQTGCYWSSTYKDEDDSYYVSFNTNAGINAANDRFVYRGLYVRLVKNVK